MEGDTAPNANNVGECMTREVMLAPNVTGGDDGGESWSVVGRGKVMPLCSRDLDISNADRVVFAASSVRESVRSIVWAVVP
jgi:hypothetical protein